ncbi:MAG: efflux RND transporter periplasmic adaptor subunit, partial [Staphylococcus epidermidis]|nr:efflux RND transporter periplasmic adaptor subunit [Staphylococcus epidermidis]
MNKKLLWSIIGIVIIVVLIIAAFILKQVNGSGSKDSGQTVKQGERIINYDTNGNKRQQLVNKVNQAQSQVNDDYQKVNQSPNNHQLQVKLTQDQSALNEAQQSLSQYDRQLNDSMNAS